MEGVQGEEGSESIHFSRIEAISAEGVKKFR